MATSGARRGAERRRPVRAPRREWLGGQLVRGPLLPIMLVVAVVATLVGTSYVQRAFRDAAVRQQIRTADIVVSLSVGRNIGIDQFEEAAVSSDRRADLDADIEIVLTKNEIVGIEVWNTNGQLIYADSGHPAEETKLPEAELERALLGQSFVEKNDDGERGVPLLEVFTPTDVNADGVIDGVIEVLLPLAKIDSAVESNVVRLRIGAAVALLIVGWTLVAMRRRLRLRNFQAEHDPLTGLGNRTLLARRGAALTRDDPSSTSGSSMALLLIDLDGFKRVNDALGHAVGDDVLVAVAGRLRRVVNEAHALIRLGGDEFAVLLSPSDEADAADQLAARVIDSLTEPVTVGAVCMKLGASIGIADRTTAVDVGELLRRADVAMYQAKRLGGGYLRYSSETDDNDADHLSLLGDVAQAIDRDELVLEYQPKIDPQRQLTGAEALIRWNHPTRGRLEPDTFLPLVEETAMMKPLTAWVLDRAAAQASQWSAKGWSVPVAVNVSPRTLIDPDFVNMVDTALSANHLAGELLTIEITETAILESPSRARLVIAKLRSFGVGVSIDDFGTGFTSLAHLRELPISQIKIDQTFVHDLVDGGIDHSIVEYTIRLAHDLGIPVVAEGVETRAALDELTVLGCDEFQGFLIAHPLDALALESWMESQSLAGVLPVS